MPRGKHEKGKGGYWQLSLNANKSERKRIRNRKKRPPQIGSSRSLASGTMSRGQLPSMATVEAAAAEAARAAEITSSQQPPTTAHDYCTIIDSTASAEMVTVDGEHLLTISHCDETSYVLDASDLDPMIVDNVAAHIEVEQQPLQSVPPLPPPPSPLPPAPPPSSSSMNGHRYININAMECDDGHAKHECERHEVIYMSHRCPSIYGTMRIRKPGVICRLKIFLFFVVVVDKRMRASFLFYFSLLLGRTE